MSEPKTTLMPLPRSRPRIYRMHVVDAGDGCSGMICQFKCSRCGHRSDWIRMETVTEAKRGLPCPNCNKEAA